MIEHLPDGTLRCFKCCKRRQDKDFLYTHKAKTVGELAGWVEHGHAWACEACFLRSNFSKMVLDRNALQRMPSEDLCTDDNKDDLFECITCKGWRPPYHFMCYGRWYEGDQLDHADALHACMHRKCLQWGCENCFTSSQLYCLKNFETGKWRTPYNTRSRHASTQSLPSVASDHDGTRNKKKKKQRGVVTPKKKRKILFSRRGEQTAKSRKSPPTTNRPGGGINYLKEVPLVVKVDADEVVRVHGEGSILYSAQPPDHDGCNSVAGVGMSPRSPERYTDHIEFEQIFNLTGQ